MSLSHGGWTGLRHTRRGQFVQENGMLNDGTQGVSDVGRMQAQCFRPSAQHMLWIMQARLEGSLLSFARTDTEADPAWEEVWASVMERRSNLVMIELSLIGIWCGAGKSSALPYPKNFSSPRCANPSFPLRSAIDWALLGCQFCQESSARCVLGRKVVQN